MSALLAEGRTIAVQALRRKLDLAACREQVERAARQVGCFESELGRVQLCCGEACTNALVHGGGGEMRIMRTPNALRVAVRDRGPGLAVAIIPCVARMSGFSTRRRSLGMGFAIMRELADRLYLSTGADGTVVLLEFTPSPPG